ncbi:MAG TPA: chemotaxis protein CheW [Chloroflexota bacterium]|nr:chemotaxis protein CheW [Chloroflexota bacterium]
MVTRAVGRSALTAAERDAVFARRADELAEMAPGEGELDDSMEVLVFSLGRESYALPATQVHEVRPLGGLTPLPGTPAFLAGLINVRGRIVPVVDLRPLLGLASDACSPSMSVVLVGNRSGDVGLLVTDRPTVRPLRAANLTEPPPGPLAGLDPSCVRGITPDLTIVLDAERLLSDIHLVVQHDILPKI